MKQGLESDIWMQRHHVCGHVNTMVFGPEHWFLDSSGNQPKRLSGRHQLLDSTRVSQLIWPSAFPGMTNKFCNDPAAEFSNVPSSNDV
jgi:hypothetical protein